MDFFKKLQEVTDLTNVTGGGGGSGGGASGGSGTGRGGGSSDDRESMSAEDLRDELRAAEAELVRVRTQWEALQKESQATQDEYSAYKTKVTTWREQMKSARQQDRRTIDLLRAEINNLTANGASGAGSSSSGGSGGSGSGGASGSGVGDGGSGGSGIDSVTVDKTYIASLEEQVRSLKETIREYGNERDKLEIELKRVKSRAAAAEAELTAATMAKSAGADASPAAAANVEEIARRAARATELEDEVERLRRQIATLEGTVDQLTDEAAKSSTALVEAMQRHRAEMRELEALSDRDKQMQYIRDLERELNRWRKLEAQRQQQQQQLQQHSAATVTGDSSGSGGDAASPLRREGGDGAGGDFPGASPLRESGSSATPTSLGGGGGIIGGTAPTHPPMQTAAVESSLRTISQLEGRVSLLQEKLAAKDEVIAKLDALVAELQAERNFKESNIDVLYEEGNQLRERIEELTQMVAFEQAACADWRAKVAKVEGDLLAAREAAEEAAEKELASARAAAKAQRDLAERNEAVRLLRQDLARAQQLARTPAPGSAAVAIGPSTSGSSGDAGALAGASPTTAASTGGTATATPLDDPLSLNFNFSRNPFGQSALSVEQVKALWQQMMTKQRTVFSSTRARMYVAIGALVALIVLFSIYQSGSIYDDDTIAEQFAQCKENLKAAKLQLRSANGGGGGAPVAESGGALATVAALGAGKA